MSEFQKILNASRGMSQQREFEKGGGTEKTRQERLDLSLIKGAVSRFDSANQVSAYSLATN